MKTVFLTFKKPFGPYAVGDKAGFEAEAAERYLSLGVATRDKDAAQTQGAASAANKVELPKKAVDSPLPTASAAPEEPVAVEIATQAADAQNPASAEDAQVLAAEPAPAKASGTQAKGARDKAKEGK